MPIFTTDKGVQYGWQNRDGGWGPGMEENLRRLSDYAHDGFARDYLLTVGLNLALRPGIAMSGAGVNIRVAPAPIALTNNAVNYVERTIDGVVSKNNVGFTADLFPIGKATTLAGQITAWEDWRALGNGIGYFPASPLEVGVMSVLWERGNAKRHGVATGVVGVTQHVQLNNMVTSVDALGGGTARIPSELGEIWIDDAQSYTLALCKGIRLVGCENVTLAIEPGVVLRALANNSPLFGTITRGAVVLVADTVNCRVTGGGTIEGERDRHVLAGGEDGHCIGIFADSIGSVNLEIDHLTLRDAWGDCLFVGINDARPYSLQQWNRNVRVHHLTMTRGRRQGMSVVNVVGMTFWELTIDTAGGTAPGAAIDLEPQFGLLNYPAGPNQFAPVEDVIGFGMHLRDCVYGLVITAGAQRVTVSDLHIRNSYTHDIFLSGFGGVPGVGQVECEDILVTKFYILHDEAVAPVPLPTAVSTQNGIGHRIGEGKIRGRFLCAVHFAGGGTNLGGHHGWKIDVEADANCLHAFWIHNTAIDCVLDECSANGAQINCEVALSDRVKVRKFVSRNATTRGFVWDGCHHGEFSVNDYGSQGVFAVQLSNSDYNTATAVVRRAAQEGVRITAANHNDLRFNVSESSQSVNNLYANVQFAGGSSYNRCRAFVRPGVLANKPNQGVIVNAGCLENDLRGSDLRGGHTADYSFLEPTTIYKRRPGFSADRGDASVVLTALDEITQLFQTALTVPRTCTVPAAGRFVGMEFEVLRSGLGAGTLDVKDGGVSLKLIPAATAARVVVKWTGAAWVLADYSPL